MAIKAKLVKATRKPKKKIKAASVYDTISDIRESLEYAKEALRKAGLA